MVAPHTVLASVKEAIKSSDRLPDDTSYATFELDTDGAQANVRPPVVEITTVDTIRSSSMNTDYVRAATDDAGNEIGEIYRAAFEMPVQIDVWTAEGGGNDPRTLANEIRQALYRYETRGYDDVLPDPNGTGNVSDVGRFQLGDGQPANDLTMTPALRRWRQNATVWFDEVIDTSEEYETLPYIDSVIVPEDGDWAGGVDIDIVFDATPSQFSDADDYT